MKAKVAIRSNLSYIILGITASFQPMGGDNLDNTAHDTSSRALLHLQIRDYFSWLLATEGRGKKVLQAIQVEFPDLIGDGTLDLARMPYLLQASRYFGSTWASNMQSEPRKLREAGNKVSRKRKARDLLGTGLAKTSLSRRKTVSQSVASSKKYNHKASLTCTGEDFDVRLRKGVPKVSKATHKSISGATKKDIRTDAASTYTARQISVSSKVSNHLVSAMNTGPGADEYSGSQFESGLDHQLFTPPAQVPPVTHMHQNAMDYHHHQMMQHNMALQAHHASQNPGYGFMFAQSVSPWPNFAAHAGGQGQSSSHSIVHPDTPK